jgi:hypothetical protein
VLSPYDTNGGVQDVYEWEPDGTETNGVVTCKRVGGCVFLISSGNSANDSMFVDSSANGDDAFFVTRQQLLRRDTNDQLDLYDARAPRPGGETVGFPETETAPCSEEACRGPLSAPPAQQLVGSAGFTGPGNLSPPPPAPPVRPKPLTRAQQLAKALKACRTKHVRHRRVLCERKARKRYGPARPAKRSAKGPRK